MKRIFGTFLATAAMGCNLAGTAQAATTPGAVTNHAGQISTTSAVVHATVNPRGVATDFTFNYGLTPSYGAATVARSAGSGKRPIAVSELITGLEPGTTYNFQVVAVSAAGSTVGADVTFTTTGAPPSAVTTGAAVNIGKERAELTGTIDPNGPATSWYFQYGLTTAYGMQDFPSVLAAGVVADPVATTLTGLAPATLFHYRVVAFHGSTPTYGADGTFFTRPDHPPAADLHAQTSPSRDSSSPYRFTTRGTLDGGQYIPSAQRCSGTVGISYYNGSHRLAFIVADVGSNCRFTGAAEFRHTDGHGRVALRVAVDYRGNGYLAAENRADHVTVGR